MRELTHLSLFSGIGGLDLAAEWAGFQTVGQCEWAEYPTKVLEKHWPDVPRWKDIRTLTGDDFYERTGLRTVDVISGGFPCQPFSVAGKRRGREDDRFLWPEMVRIIKELRPAWVVGENVAGIVSMALDDVLSDLEAEGYQTRTFLIPACAVGAPHRRYRTAILAYTKIKHSGRMPVRKEAQIAGSCGSSKNVQYTDSPGRKEQHASKEPDKQGFTGSGCDAGNVCHATGQGFQDGAGQPVGGQGAQEPESQRPDSYASNADSRKPVRRKACTGEHTEIERGRENNRGGMPEYAGREWWAVEPGMGRVAYGVPARVDRLKCLGNAVVPQQFYPVFKAIAGIEEITP